MENTQSQAKHHALQIPLTQDKFTLIDSEDLEKVSHYKWFYGQGYAKTNSGKLLMHRLILDFPEGYIDHKNGNGLDNRKGNLRVCNQSKNIANQGICKTNTSGYKGVSWQKNEKKWRSYIHVNQKYIHLGYYRNKKEAAKAYDEAALNYFGEFARMNYV